MLSIKNTLALGITMLCLGSLLYAKEINKPVQEKALPSRVLSEVDLYKRLQEIIKKRQEVRERRNATVAKLVSIVKACRDQGITLNRELRVLAEELANLEKKMDSKKKACDQIKELRTKLEATKHNFAHGTEGDLLVNTVKQLEHELKAEEQLIAEEAHVRNQLDKQSAKPAVLTQANPAPDSRYARLRLLIKPALAFAGGAAVIAFLHWTKIITIPQA